MHLASPVYTFTSLMPMSWPAQTLRSRVRVTFEAWIYNVYVLSAFMLSCVVVALRRADSPSKKSYRISVRLIISELFLNRNGPDSLIRQGRGRRSEMSYHIGAFGIKRKHLMSSPCSFVHLLSSNRAKYTWFVSTTLFDECNQNCTEQFLILRTSSSHTLR
jgi:hypothetical protein